MRKITVSVLPMPVSGPSNRRRETALQTLRREWRAFWKSSYAGYNED